MLPNKLIAKECIGEKPKETPNGIAPLSSIIGNAAVSNTVNSVVKNFSISVINIFVCYLFIDWDSFAVTFVKYLGNSSLGSS